jgi:hypothetical protein
VKETPRAEGTLAERDLPELVHDLHRASWGGVLHLSSVGIAKSIVFSGGRMVFASSSDPDERLGEVLLLQGRITYRQYLEASRRIAPGRRMGTILVEQGILSGKDLVRAVVDQTRQVILDAFRWEEGRYRLQEGPPPAEAITLNISTPALILEGIGRIDSWSRLTRAVGGGSARYGRAENWEALLAGATLSEPQAALVRALNGDETVGELCDRPALSTMGVCRTLWALRVIGVVRRLDRALAPPPDHGDDGLALVLGTS